MTERTGAELLAQLRREGLWVDEAELLLDGCVLLTAAEAEKVRTAVRHAFSCPQCSVFAPKRKCNCGRDNALALLSPAGKDET